MATDLYAFAATLRFALGEDGTSIPPPLEAILASCLEERAADRPATADEVAERLRAVDLSPPEPRLWVLTTSVGNRGFVEEAIAPRPFEHTDRVTELLESVLAEGAALVVLDATDGADRALEALNALRTFPVAREVPVAILAEDASLRAVTAGDPCVSVLSRPWREAELRRLVPQ